MKKKYIVRFIIAGILVVIGIISYLFGINDYINLSYVRKNHDYFVSLISQYYGVALIIYTLLYIPLVYFMIPITIIVAIAGGYFFGIIWGTIGNIIGCTVGALLSFLSFRYLIGSYIKDRYKGEITTFNKKFVENGASYLLAMQFLPATPFGLITIYASSAGISLWTFLWTTAVGIFPGTLLYTIAGRQLDSIESTKDIFSFPVIVLMICLSLLALFPLVFRKIKK